MKEKCRNKDAYVFLLFEDVVNLEPGVGMCRGTLRIVNLDVVKIIELLRKLSWKESKRMIKVIKYTLTFARAKQRCLDIVEQAIAVT
jgi:hypothetical protein